MSHGDNCFGGKLKYGGELVVMLIVAVGGDLAVLNRQQGKQLT